MPEVISKETVEKFIATLDDKHIVAMKIAQEQLESSFDVTKCIGFKEWYSSQEKN